MRTHLATIVLLAFAVAGCSSESTAPSPGTASYIAVVPASAGATPLGMLLFTTTTNGVATDHVAAGAEVRLALSPDGTTSGRLFIPDAPDGNGGTADFDADLAGTWSKTGDTISLRHAADTFLRDMPLLENGDQLVGDRTFGTVRVRLTLVRQ
jgi:hypothetical protein